MVNFSENIREIFKVLPQHYFQNVTEISFIIGKIEKNSVHTYLLVSVQKVLGKLAKILSRKISDIHVIEKTFGKNIFLTIREILKISDNLKIILR